MAKVLFSIVVAMLGVANAQVGYNVPTPNGPGYSYGAPDLQAAASSFDVAAAEDPIAALAANIPGGGVPGEDYPILASVPDTGFSCEDQQFPGYYADTAPEAGCQVFHICQFDGRHDAFLCPNGTIFNQQYFVCDWWFNVDCAASEQFVGLNADIGKVPDKRGRRLRRLPRHLLRRSSGSGLGSGPRAGSQPVLRRSSGSGLGSSPRAGSQPAIRRSQWLLE
ncbi:uncharacterized protein LOC125035336 [Penaeus chinensis]|uniref:uncharacterized protein LOC125035336 n=1 Tax=Penaeus chinensis TaxID=139456 RepID=UPI001FB6DBC4|nr:uncharacterized protein LOC125035336 [Penaeus chinensis]